MDLAQLRQLLNRGGGGGGNAPAADTPQPDTAEKVQISSLSLLKMLKHGNLHYKQFEVLDSFLCHDFVFPCISLPLPSLLSFSILLFLSLYRSSARICFPLHNVCFFFHFDDLKFRTVALTMDVFCVL